MDARAEEKTNVGEWVKTGDFAIQQQFVAGLVFYKCTYHRGTESILLESLTQPAVKEPSVEFKFSTTDATLVEKIEKALNKEPHYYGKPSFIKGFNETPSRISFDVTSQDNEEALIFFRILNDIYPLEKPLRAEIYHILRLTKGLQLDEEWASLKQCVDSDRIMEAIDKITKLPNKDRILCALALYCENKDKKIAAIQLLEQIKKDTWFYSCIEPKLKELKPPPAEKKEDSFGKIPPGQSPYIFPRTFLGYPQHIGVCHGVACEGMFAVMTRALQAFSTRYKIITNTEPHKVPVAVEDAKQTLKNCSLKARAELEEKSKAEWELTFATLKQTHNDEKEFKKAVHTAILHNQKKYNSVLNQNIQKQLDGIFQNKEHARKRFEALLEMDASAQTDQVHNFPLMHKELFPEEEPVYAMQALPNDLNKIVDAFVFINPSQAEGENQVKLFHITAGNCVEIQIKKQDSIKQLLEEKGINPHKPLQKQFIFSKEKMDILWKEIQGYPVADQRKSTFLRDPEATINLLIPKKLEDKGAAKALKLYSGIYPTQEIADYLKDLQRIIDSKNPAPSSPLGILLTHFLHAISISYDPLTKEWILVDANNLDDLEKKYETTSDLAKEIVENLLCEDISCFSSKMYATAEDAEIYQACIQEWENTDSFKRAHKVTEEKSKLKDKVNGTWLFQAFVTDDLETFDQLLKAGADPTIVPKNGNSLFVTLLLLDYAETLNKLLPFFNVNLPITGDVAPLIFVAQHGYPHTVKTLLTAANIDISASCKASTKVLLDLAKKSGREEHLKTLFKKYGFENQDSFLGYNALHAAAFFNHTETLRILLPHDKQAGIALLDIAFAMNYSDMAQMLLENAIARKSNADDPTHSLSRIILHRILQATHEEKGENAHLQYNLFSELENIATKLMKLPFYENNPEKLADLKLALLKAYHAFSETVEIEKLKHILESLKLDIKNINGTNANLNTANAFFDPATAKDEQAPRTILVKPVLVLQQ